ncbi:DUF3450 domain-containing protein [Planctobacterium marinum]|uniref:DUF3450 domain-containing protein n=1 Tax=Planctobacterium marinum TaxID=1631968 RepID=UPI001E5CD665|nr:DUF3450 domain-containing protein [Planctobacterium marinum]MCC2604981.1 DUF3450 domain-containing protein [Planctobacterium marinum]
MKFSKTFTLSVVAAALSVTAMTGSAQEDGYIKPAIDTAKQINESAATSQEKVNAYSEQVGNKLQTFKTINKETDGLRVYNTQLEKQIANQVAEMAALNKSIDEVSVIERQITPLMIRMIDGLEQFVELDVPFLPKERSDRIESLRDMMDRADVSSSEKFRRVMEAYQVEMDYGRTMEAYSGILSLGGQERDVDFLRVGRTVLAYQTRDGSEQGVWNQDTKTWDMLDSSYRTQLTSGLRMAKKQKAPDLLMLPVKKTN